MIHFHYYYVYIYKLVFLAFFPANPFLFFSFLFVFFVFFFFFKKKQMSFLLLSIISFISIIFVCFVPLCQSKSIQMNIYMKKKFSKQKKLLVKNKDKTLISKNSWRSTFVFFFPFTLTLINMVVNLCLVQEKRDGKKKRRKHCHTRTHTYTTYFFCNPITEKRSEYQVQEKKKNPIINLPPHNILHLIQLVCEKNERPFINNQNRTKECL